MSDVRCMPGDLLFYFDAPNLETRLIQAFEEEEENDNGPWPYHCAIALGPDEKIEANGKHVARAPIDYGRFVVCRPPYDPPKLARALMWARKQEGKLYGFLGILDQFLRAISGGKLHLPKRLIVWIDNRMPYCSTYMAAFVTRTGALDIPPYPPPTPADGWKRARRYLYLG